MPALASPSQQGLPEALLRAFDTKTVFDECDKPLPLDSNVSLSEAQSLYDMVRTLGATHTAEVGLAKGISAMAICKALDDNNQGHHDVMDPFQANYGNAGVAMLHRAGLDKRVTFHRAFAEEVFPSLQELDFVFIDASHLFDLTLVEFVLADKKLRTGGVIAFHDMWMPSLRKVLRYVLTNRSYRIVKPAVSPGGPVTPVSARPARWNLLRWVPLANRLLRPEILRRWQGFQADNLVFVQKVAEDRRDWTHHQDF